MAVAGDKEVYFGDELSANMLRDLNQRFPEIPADVVSSSLKKNGGNMSHCIAELEHVSPTYMYSVVSHNTPMHIHTGGTLPNTAPEINHSTSGYSSPFYSPEQGMHVHVHAPGRDSYNPEYLPMGIEDPEKTPQPSFTSWATLETGITDMEPQRESRQHPLSAAGNRKHVSLCTLDIQKPPMRTVSVPQISTGHVIRSVSPMPGGLQYVEGDPIHRQSSNPYGQMKANGLEQILDPQEFPFEPRPAWQEDSAPLQHFSESSQSNQVGVVSNRWTPPPAHVNPTESRHSAQPASSYQLDPLQPSSPVPMPRKGKLIPSPVVAAYSTATESISLNLNDPTSPTHEPSRVSPMLEDGVLVPQTPPDQTVAGFGGGDPVPPNRGQRAKQRNSSLMPPTIPREGSLSKEKEDQAYTEALLMHQRARYERLIKELEEERKKLAHKRHETSGMEQEVSHKRNHRSPFPTPEAIGKLREQKRQLQIDIECMTREIESYKSQGLMDVTQANSFYRNIGSTGAPGPVPPIPPHSNIIPETVLDSETSPPSYESVIEDVEQMWSCSACTLLNHPALDKCECCEMPRDK